MIENIFHLLDIIKKNKQGGRYIDIALGKHKYPHTVSEGVKLLRRTLWSREY